MAHTRLAIEGVSVRYGGVQAVSQVNFDVGHGELVGLIGPNGAGKTSLIDAITGFTASTGNIVLDGSQLAGMSATRRARLGLRRSFQTAELFDELTVRETLEFAAVANPIRTGFRQFFSSRRQELPGVELALELLGLLPLADASVESLTQGQRKLVDVARALAPQPAVVCLDEPAAGLDTQESQELGRRLMDVTATGTAVLLVDHDMGLVLNVSDRVVVIEFGHVIALGTPDQIRIDPKVVEAYLGSSAERVVGTEDIASTSSEESIS